ncbi:reverse transcriptase domain-containing protein [Tanacetum coccineum]
MTVVKNEKDELIPQRIVTGWRVCIDYHKLNNATQKNHFPLPFIDQMLERLAGHEYYCFLDGFSGYFQILIAPEDQDKTTFTCPYGTFAYKRMPFGLCNAPTTFQRCMTAIFHELIEDSMEVFMDDFSVFGSSFDHYLKNLEKMLKRCEETNLVLNWEKCHFMVKEGIALGHKVSGSGIEVDKAKIKAISKLPNPTNVKAIRSFLGHASFYRRFIKDFSQIARPMTQLLVKDAPFNFLEDCIQAFDTLKQFDIEIRDKKGVESLAADHLSRLEHPGLGKLTRAEIKDIFPEERLMTISNKNNEPCLLTESYEDAWPEMKQNKFFDNVTAGHPEDIMASSPPQGKSSRLGKISARMTKHPSKITYPSCEICQSLGDILHAHSWENLSPLINTVTNTFIVAIDYVSKWVEAQAFPTSDARNVVNFLRRLFARFEIPKALISDRGTHFCNYQMEKAMKQYRVVHQFSTAYNPQTNGQVENTNRAIKRILEKSIGNNRKDWSYKLDDALWAFRIAFKTPLGTTLFRIIYGKACHLPLELEHKAYWAIKNCNMDLTKAEENRFLKINELDKMRPDAYESSISYKERMKRWHDKRIKLPINYEKGDKVLLFNLRLRLFPRKLKSRWYGPFLVSKDMENRAIELYDEEGSEFIVNKQRVKPYQKNFLDTNKGDDVTLDDEGEFT